MLILQYKTGTLVVYNFETPATIPELIPYVLDDDIFTHHYISEMTPDVDEVSFAGEGTGTASVPAIESGSTSVGGSQDPNAWWLTTQVETFCDPGSGNTVQFFIYPPGWYTPTQSANTSLAVGIGDPCTP